MAAPPDPAPVGSKPGSKYDYVKVRVWLGKQWDHYYVLSRFSLSRMLTASRVPKRKAVAILLELKKSLVDTNRLDVSQAQLETELFRILRAHGYGQQYVDRFRMITTFYHEKISLVVIICGTICAGKSLVATKLAERLNLPHVLQTDLVAHLIRMSANSPLAKVPSWCDPAPGVVCHDHKDKFLREFRRECSAVRKSVEGDLGKAIKEGKSIILEGLYQDLGTYLHDFRPQKGPADSESRDPAERPSSPSSAASGLPAPGAPVVVPIILAMPPEQRNRRVGEWTELNHARLCAGGDGEGAKARLLERARGCMAVLQEYLERNYGGQVKTCVVDDPGDPQCIEEVVDGLHGFLLEQIQRSVPQRGGADREGEGA